MALLLAATVARAQPADTPLLTVVLADGRSRSFTRAALEALPQEKVSATLRDGAPFSVSGVSVAALLNACGLDLSQRMGAGNVVGHALIARAADGYRAVFGLAEVDPHFGHAALMVNWTNADGAPLPERVGPLQLISTGESRPGRWVRQLRSLEVKSLP